MTCAETFRTLFSEFSDVSDDDLNSYIEIFAPLVSEKQFGNKYNLALAYLVAHKMAMNGLGSSSDNVLGYDVSVSEAAAYSAAGITSIKDGESSLSFSAGSSSSSSSSSADSEFEKTMYGQQYLSIRAASIIPIIAS